MIISIDQLEFTLNLINKIHQVSQEKGYGLLFFMNYRTESYYLTIGDNEDDCRVTIRVGNYFDNRKTDTAAALDEYIESVKDIILRRYDKITNPIYEL